MEHLPNASISHSERPLSSKELEARADILLEKRLLLVNEWMSAARSVAERAGNEAAYETWHFLEERAALGVPIPQKEGAVMRILAPEQKGDQSYYVYLTPILESDESRLPDGDARRDAVIGDVKWAGMFDHVVRAVYFTESITLSETGKGLVLLHEAVHARNEIEKRIDRRQPEAYWLDEADANVVEFEILKALGGDGYRRLVERVETLADTRSQYKWTEEDGAVLDSMFGADISKRERRRWGIVIGRAILYDWYKLNKPDPRQALALLLKQKAKEERASVVV
jgi:hypothetical protein